MKIDKEKIIEELKLRGVSKAAIFGSFARGMANKNSDLDIIVEFGDRRSLFDLAAFKIELERLLRRKVDIITYDSLHPLLRDRILKEQEIIL